MTRASLLIFLILPGLCIQVSIEKYIPLPLQVAIAYVAGYFVSILQRELDDYLKTPEQRLDHARNHLVYLMVKKYGIDWLKQLIKDAEGKLP